MALLSPIQLFLEENADFDRGLGFNFALFTDANFTVPFDLTGYTCSMMVRVNINDIAPVVTYTGTVGGSLGTVQFLFTAAGNTSLLALLPNGTAVYDIILVNVLGVKSHLVPSSGLSVVRSVTR